MKKSLEEAEPLEASRSPAVREGSEHTALADALASALDHPLAPVVVVRRRTLRITFFVFFVTSKELFISFV